VKAHSVASFVLADGQAGVKVICSEPCSHYDLQEIGEHIAHETIDCGAAKVFVWVYGHDMRVTGPAALLTFHEQGEPNPFSSVVDSRLIAYHYAYGPPLRA
jgi:hypothetical protein